MRRIQSALLISGAATLWGCEASTVPETAVIQNGGLQPIPAYVDTWLDLNEYFGQSVASTSIGGETAIELRFDAESHHEFRCLTTKHYATIGVSFNGLSLYEYSVDCRPALFSYKPSVGSKFNISQTVRLSTPSRNLSLVRRESGANFLVFTKEFDIDHHLGSDMGDFELVCQEAGEAVMHLEFEPDGLPSAQDFTLVCEPQHDQGGGA
jgi:hypothetical protein